MKALTQVKLGKKEQSCCCGKNEFTVAQCCSKSSKIIAGCHD
ncbi:hypothetical protein [Zhaonella formicivorans]|nr:hypothetical protein [Zhaonella formicivorans]